ncbi:MAG: type I methionyl aminopeptidase [Chloroflexi bacterium AL-W]|nr:type I methionyl aminopeptidase [Chloroflexi bacterium AL-N1]NOK66755.1 type I methionyl aminopeptidase [Chloroflexi bacterium AL-N10]NOK74953.1 type I methionyl aminopeptidase [Chloroflexi bacterium AL-N5]NOK81358.1 type I methionyl aminopeptidase [Chloroflexi bacterium AL-W]NOK88827.1 type I methionyl aminopeptidase [Chloroflexi bacterium AL-N15]
MAITLKNKSELQKMRRAGRIVGDCHCLLREAIRPGITTAALDKLVHTYITQQNGIPSFLGYPGPTPYPAATCISVNEEVVHGIPGSRLLQEGDIVSVDIGVIWQGYHGDSAWSYPVGAIDLKARQLLETTEQTLYHALTFAQVGGRLGDISHSIQHFAESHGLSVVRKYTSHGIGKSLHEEPEIRNYGRAGRGVRLREGMTLAIEPIVTQGSHAVRECDDGWTAVTVDGTLAAHFEHTIAITEDNGPEVLTRQDKLSTHE